MRKLCCFAVPFSAAIFCAVFLLPEHAAVPVGLMCGAAALLSFLLKGDRRLRALLLIGGLAAGLLWTGAYRAIFIRPAEALDGQTREITAKVIDWPQVTDYGVRVTVRLTLEGAPDPTVTLYADKVNQTLRPGDRITLSAKLRRADLRYGEQTDYNRSRGITLLATAKGEIVVTTPNHIPPSCYPAYVAKAIKQSVTRAFPQITAPFIIALITGDKSALPHHLYASVQRTGLAHVVAVSGLHISFLVGLVTTLLTRRRRTAAALCIVLMIFFAAATGNTPSVLRAVFMQSFLLLAPLFGREEDKATTLSCALMLLLLANPFAAASVSLQLSFASVAGIYLFTARLNEYLTGRMKKMPAHKLASRALRVGIGTLATTLGAMAFTTPLTAYYFGSVSLVAPLTNLFTLWAIPFAFLGGLITAVVGLIAPALAVGLGVVVSVPVWWVTGIAGLLSRIPVATAGMDSIYLRLWLMLCYGLLLLYLLWRGEGKRPVVPIGISAVTLCAALLMTGLGRSAGSLTVSALDVGQGLSVAFYSKGHAVLVDCGGNSAADPGDVAADYFNSIGMTKIDMLVLTHYHKDHASGVPELLERIGVGLIVLPDVEETDPLRMEIIALAEEKGIAVQLIDADAQVIFGKASMRIYAPLGAGETNEEGLSVLCTSGDFDTLVTGDMGTTVEWKLVRYGNLPDIELLVAGHHGSKYASSERLLEETRPESAIISVGRNSYGHPAPETMRRLEEAGCDIYRTDLAGTVTIIIE